MLDLDLKKLDELVKKMESADLPLDQALACFQEGVDLVRRCTKTLEEAEFRVKEILEKSAGSFEQKPLS